MKKARLLTGIAVAATAAMAMTTMASAYDLGEKNLGKNWSLNIEVPASEFADVTADSYITITFTADPAETEYWCIKPCVNDGGWIFIADAKYLAEGEDVGTTIADAGDSFTIDSADVTSVTFKVPSGAVDLLKEGGMPIMGHSITLKELTISDEAPAAPAPDDGGDETQAPDNGNTDVPTADKNTPDTGVEGVAIVAALAIVATGAVVVARKRK